jgi:hypothetical protein
VRYYDDMTDRYGFKGDTIPEYWWLYRQVYVEVTNRLLAKHNSQVRLVAPNEGRVMIMRVSKEALEGLSREQVYNGTFDASEVDQAACDEGWDAAWETLQEGDLEYNVDGWVQCEAKLHPSYDEFLASL